MPDIKDAKIEITNDIQTIQSKLVEYLYWIFIISMWLAIGSSVLRALNTGIQPYIYIQGTLVIAFLIVFFVRKKLNYNTKSIILLILVYLLGQSGFLSFGILSQGPLFFILLIVLSAILYNKKISYFVFGFVIISFILDGILYTNGMLDFIATEYSYTNTFANWLLSLTILSLITFIIIFTWHKIVNFLIDRISKINLQENRLQCINNSLQEEIVSRVKAEIQLKNKVEEIELLNKELNDSNTNFGKANLLLSEAKEKVQLADNLKSSFLSNMSHEIRTPMNAIIGFSSLLSNPELTKNDFNRYIDVIQSSSSNLLNIISDIENMSKIEARQFAIYPEVIDLNDFIDDLTEHYTREIFIAKEGDVMLQIQKKLNDQSKIITDLESLKQITNKLIDNAIKFTTKGEVSIEIELLNDGKLCFKIKDTGIGIPSDKLEEIFGNFMQADRNHTRKYGGTGLGLSIVKGLLNLLNGEIKFESVVNKGSEFNISIPVLKYHEVKTTENHQIFEVWKGKTVLIVGKTIWNEYDLREILQSSNLFLLYTETGFQALETFQQHPEVDLIILSLHLQDMNSSEIASILKKQNSDIPIIIFNDNLNSNILTNNNQFWDGAIQLPLNKIEVINKLNEFLKQQSHF